MLNLSQKYHFTLFSNLNVNLNSNLVLIIEESNFQVIIDITVAAFE